MKYNNYTVIVGRMHGYEEATMRSYEHLTQSQAVQRFTNELRLDAGVSEVDVVAEYDWANVYIDFIFHSGTPIEVVEV
jgi:hypothetical protein